MNPVATSDIVVLHLYPIEIWIWRRTMFVTSILGAVFECVSAWVCMSVSVCECVSECVCVWVFEFVCVCVYVWLTKFGNIHTSIYSVMAITSCCQFILRYKQNMARRRKRNLVQTVWCTSISVPPLSHQFHDSKTTRTFCTYITLIRILWSKKFLSYC